MRMIRPCSGPQGYAPIRTPARKLMATPTPFGQTPLYAIPEEDRNQAFDVAPEIEGLPEMKPEDHQYFGKLLKVSICLSVLLCACPFNVMCSNTTLRHLWAVRPMRCAIPCSATLLTSHQSVKVLAQPGFALCPVVSWKLTFMCLAPP